MNNRYQKTYNDFVKEIAQSLINMDYVIVEYLANAIDGLDANGWDIQTIINIYSNEEFDNIEIFEKPYYINKLLSNRSNMKYDNNYISGIIMDIIWDELDNNETYSEMFDDLYDINSIVNKYDYGGGGYEFKIQLVNDIVKEAMRICQDDKVNESIYTKSDKHLLESLVEKYGAKGVEVAINRLNEWNMWDKPKSGDFYSAAIRQAERNRPRLIDVVDELPKRNHDAQRYKDDPEYYEHIKRLERQLEKITDPQEAEYLERRINKLKSLSESTIDRLDEKRQHLWCGVPEVYHIYNGDWETPEVEYNGYRCSEWDIQDSMIEYMKERIADGEDWGDPSNDKDFCRFCQAHAEEVQQDIIEFSGCDESLSESAIDRLTEDSLDDFDIDGRIKRKRNSVDTSYKNQFDIKCALIINKIKNLSKDFLDKRNIRLRDVDCYTTNWLFTYSPDDLMEFVITLSNNNEMAKECLKELIKILKNNIDGIYGTNINDKSGIYHNELKLSVYMTVDNIVNY